MMRTWMRIGAVAATWVMLTGGIFGVWSGFRALVAADYRQAATAAPCPMVGTQNLTAARRDALLAALADVCEILADPEFARRVGAEPEWVADCLPGGVPGRRMSAAEVLAVLTPPHRRFSVVARKPWNAVAVTNLGYQAIAIRKRRFDGWMSGVPARQAKMIETLAHEMSHLEPEAEGSIRSMFRDEYHVASTRDADRDKCLNAKLVSYDSGRIVREIWLERRGVNR